MNKCKRGREGEREREGVREKEGENLKHRGLNSKRVVVKRGKINYPHKSKLHNRPYKRRRTNERGSHANSLDRTRDQNIGFLLAAAARPRRVRAST